MPNRILGHWGTESVDLTGTFQFSTGQYGIYVIGKACVCFTLSFSEVSPKLYITSVYLLHHSLASGMSGTGHPHECFEAVIKHCHMPTWASLSTFHILLRAIMYDHKTRLYKYAPMHSCKMLLCTDLCQYICVYWCSLFFLDYIQQIIDLHAGYHYQGLKQCHIKLPTDRVHLNPAFLSNVLQFHRQWLFRRVPVKSQDF